MPVDNGMRRGRIERIRVTNPYYIVPIHGYSKSNDQFPIQKCALFCKFKEISGIARRHTTVCHTSDSADLSRRGVIDAEIVEKGHLWTETR